MSGFRRFTTKAIHIHSKENAINIYIVISVELMSPPSGEWV